MQAINPTTTSAWSRLVELSKKHDAITRPDNVFLRNPCLNSLPNSNIFKIG